MKPDHAKARGIAEQLGGLECGGALAAAYIERGDEVAALREALTACIADVEAVGDWGQHDEPTRICDQCGGAGPDGKPDEITHYAGCPFGRARALLAKEGGTE